MNHDDINPPAIVRPSCTVGELVATGKALNTAIHQGERTNLAKAIDLGKIINQLASTCDHGTLTKAYDDMRLSRQRASEYSRIAKCPAPDICQCSSIADALRLIANEGEAAAEAVDLDDDEWCGMEDDGPSLSESGDSPATNVKQDADNPAPASLAPNANVEYVPQPKRCRACRLNTNGRPKNCPDCRALNERCEGRDVEAAAAEAKTKADARNNGKETIPWKQLELHFGHVMREPDLIARAFPREKQSTEYQEMIRLYTAAASIRADWLYRLKTGKRRERNPQAES